MLFWIGLMSAQAQEVWTIPELNSLETAERVQEIVSDLPPLSMAQFSTEKNKICLVGLELNATLEADLLQRLKQQGYMVTERTPTEKCQLQVQSLWEGAEGDVVIVSTGERFSMRKSRAKGKYTLFDFGAVWCPPCQDVAKQLKPFVKDHPNFAVRSVDLGSDATDSFDHPVVFQYLSDVEAIPWLVLLDPNGKTVYKGSDVDELKALLPPK